MSIVRTPVFSRPAASILGGCALLSAMVILHHPVGTTAARHRRVGCLRDWGGAEAGATLIDGFFMPAFAAKYGVLAAIQVLTKFALFSFSGAAVLWGIDLLERPCAARITGALACAAALAEFAIVAASGTLTPRNLAVIILVQAVWCIPFASRLWNPQTRL